MRINCSKYGILAGLLLCAAGAANTLASSSLLTFNVDMSAQITAGTFVPGTDRVSVRGTFNGYNELQMSQVGATTVYTVSTNDTLDANGGQLQYKFWNNNGGGDNWETTANGQNRAARLPAVSGGSLTLPTAFFSDAGPDTPNNITFQIDMAEQIKLSNFNPGGGDTVEVQGDFQGWVTGDTLNQDTSQTGESGGQTIYTNTFAVGGSPGRIHNYKFVKQPGGVNGVYEAPSAVNIDGTLNRYVPNETLTLPVADFSDVPYSNTVTNAVLFQVDMTAQILSGKFNPATEYVCINGGFNGWASGLNYLSNNAAAVNPNLYTNIISFTNALGATEQYKFVIYDGVNTTWEALSPSTPQIGGNRYFDLVNGTSLALGPYNFSDLSASDLLPAPCSVTFSVDMSGAVGTETWPFNPLSDKVYLNGDFIPPIPENNNTGGWWAWGGSSGGIQPNPIPLPPAGYQMTEVGLTSIYRLTVAIPAGNPVPLTYKYGINGFDDEAGFAQNHVRYVRTTGAYTLPQDKFGTQTVEQSFGNLAIGTPSAGRAPITWLGRPGVRLQSRTSLTSGTWTDVAGTDGTSSTNYPTGASAAFFRLNKP